jgi:hypothetical protein
MANIYGAIALTGGGTGALDKLDGAVLSDKDCAIVVTESTIYFYFLDADSGRAEDSPSVIAPNDNPGNKRWILVGIRAVDITTDYVTVTNEDTVIVNSGEVLTN